MEKLEKLTLPIYINPEWLSNVNLTDREYRILLIIDAIIRERKENFCGFTTSNLAYASGRSSRYVQRSLKSLAEKKFIFIDTSYERIKINEPIRKIYVDEKYFISDLNNTEK